MCVTMGSSVPLVVVASLGLGCGISGLSVSCSRFSLVGASFKQLWALEMIKFPGAALHMTAPSNIPQDTVFITIRLDI